MAMRIVVIGAGGRTGARVVNQAAKRGHHVVALARRPNQVAGERVRPLAADALDRDAVRLALAECEAVISVLGVGTSRKPTTLYSEGVRNVLDAMDAHQISRLAVVSAAPVGPRDVHPLLQRRVVLPLLDLAFGETYKDMERMEAALRASTVNWVSLRPPRLIAKPERGRYSLRVDGPVAGGRSMRYGDLATALLDVVDDQALSRTAAYVAS